jgi:hypothetical protein
MFIQFFINIGELECIKLRSVFHEKRKEADALSVNMALNEHLCSFGNRKFRNSVFVVAGERISLDREFVGEGRAII